MIKKFVKHICPSQGAVFGDKGYCIKPAQTTLKKKDCHDATIARPINFVGAKLGVKTDDHF